MTVETCSFRTDRLLVQPWHDPVDDGWPSVELATAVAGLLTEPVTRHLPDSWHGPYSIDRATQWIAERDNESPTLLVLNRSMQAPVGLVFLFESNGPGSSGADSEADDKTANLVDIRLGYLLAESAWGRGLATELLGGLVCWAREQAMIGSITGGVAPANGASRRVLERLGFSLVEVEVEARGPDNDLQYTLRL